jgi:hypothetical protein
VLVTSSSRPPFVAFNFARTPLSSRSTHRTLGNQHNARPYLVAVRSRRSSGQCTSKKNSPLGTRRRRRHTPSGPGSLTSLHLGLTADSDFGSLLVRHDARRRWSGRQGRGTESAQHALARRRRRRRYRRLVLHEVLAGTSHRSIPTSRFRSEDSGGVQPSLRGRTILLESNSPERPRTCALASG